MPASSPLPFAVNDLEQHLARELVSLSSRYREALRLVEPLAAGSVDRADRDRRLEQVQSQMQAIAAHESQLRGLTSRWTSLGRAPGADLRRSLVEQQDLISTLLAQVQTCEQRLGEEHTRLVPALDVAMRRRDMQQAYARHR
jgi:hypothetical protein